MHAGIAKEKREFGWWSLLCARRAIRERKRTLKIRDETKTLASRRYKKEKRFEYYNRQKKKSQVV